MVILALVIEIPSRRRGRKPVGVFGAETEAGGFAAVGETEGETGEEGEAGCGGETDDEGDGETAFEGWVAGVLVFGCFEGFNWM